MQIGVGVIPDIDSYGPLGISEITRTPLDFSPDFSDLLKILSRKRTPQDDFGVRLRARILSNLWTKEKSQ